MVSVRRPYVRALNGGRLRKKAASARAMERRADKAAVVNEKFIHWLLEEISIEIT